MKTASVKVPVSLLLNRDLPPSAKLIWMIVGLLSPPGVESHARLEELSGLSRPTVVKGLSILSRKGLISTATDEIMRAVDPSSAGPTVELPKDLLVNRHMRPLAKLLYGFLPLAPTFEQRQFTYSQLSQVSGVSQKTVKKAVTSLACSGWLQVEQADQNKPVQFAYDNPLSDWAQAELAEVKRRIDRAQYRGEALMKEYLGTLIALDHFQDNVRPGFLINPLTKERLEFDRFYPPSVAFEFQGPQHYGPTGRFTKEEADAQLSRDLMKRGICSDRDIKLIIVHAEDLSLSGMRKKVATRLPLRDVRDQPLVLEYLESTAAQYRTAVRRSAWLSADQIL